MLPVIDGFLIYQTSCCRASVNNAFIKKLRSWLTTDWRALDDRVCGVMKNEVKVINSHTQTYSLCDKSSEYLKI